MDFINLPAITSAVYTRIYADADGAAIRSQLGADAASVISSTKIKRESLPARPFVALQRMPLATPDGLIIVPYRWFIYDDPQHGYRRIDALSIQIGRAYPSPGRAAAAIEIPDHLIHRIELQAPGPQAHDTTLNLYYSYSPIAVYVAGPRQ